MNCHARNNSIEELQKKLIQHPENDTARAQVIFRLAEAYRWVDTDSMFYYTTMLYNEAQQSRDSLQLAMGNLAMGTFWIEIFPDNALIYLDEAHRLYQKLKITDGIVSVCNQLAGAYFYMGNTEMQLYYSKKTLQGAIETNNKQKEITSLYNLSISYFAQKKYDLAEEYALIAVKESRSNGNYGLGMALSAKADAEFEKGNYDGFLESSKEMLKWGFEHGQKKITIHAQNNLVRYYIQKKEYTKAREQIRQILSEAKSEIYTEKFYQHTLKLSIAVDTLSNNFERAFQTQKVINQLETSKVSLERYQKNLHHVFNYESGRMDLQISSSEKIQKSQQSQLAKINLVIVLLVLFILSGGIYLIWIKRNLKRNKLKNEGLLTERQSVLQRKEKMNENCQNITGEILKLEKEFERLKQSDHAKTQLFETISNDLQNPINQLKEKLGNLIDLDVDEEIFKKATLELTDRVGDVSLLLENLLQWSKHQSQKRQAKPQYIDLMALVNDSIHQQKFSAGEKSIQLTNVLKHNLYVYADEEMIKSLLKTILQNTIKLSDKYSTVQISGYKNESEGQIRIFFHGHMPLRNIYLQLFYEKDYTSDLSEVGKFISFGWLFCHSLIRNNKGNIRIEETSPEDFSVIIGLPLEEEVTGK
ncbi:MAG: hypothetical protein LBQ60_17925 [Bacteroidales bacterium]|nr:hypothetical protein [Bacteroidales bacterium]